MKIVVDADKCSGHARCYLLSEELFPVDEDGYCAHRGLGEVDVPAPLEPVAAKAAAACPEKAIITVGGTTVEA